MYQNILQICKMFTDNIVGIVEFGKRIQVAKVRVQTSVCHAVDTEQADTATP